VFLKTRLFKKQYLFSLVKIWVYRVNKKTFSLCISKLQKWWSPYYYTLRSQRCVNGEYIAFTRPFSKIVNIGLRKKLFRIKFWVSFKMSVTKFVYTITLVRKVILTSNFQEKSFIVRRQPLLKYRIFGS